MGEDVTRRELLNDRGGPLHVSICVNTYNRPRFLELVLLGLTRQSKDGFEVVICDDGSTQETRDLLERMASRVPYPLTHVWHPDIGFRRARILNGGIAASRADHVVFIDDDCIPHRRFAEGHLAKKAPGVVVVGKFVKIRPHLASTITPDDVLAGRIDSAPFFPLRKKLRLFEDFLRFYKHLAQRKPFRPKLSGANFAVDRNLLYKVNGFNEAFVGWGYEDNELRMRLVNNGARLANAILAAIVFHMDEERRREEQYHTGPRNKDLFLQAKDSVWAESGLNNHTPGPHKATA